MINNDIYTEYKQYVKGVNSTIIETKIEGNSLDDVQLTKNDRIGKERNFQMESDQKKIN